jgi:hypothetical protein
MTNKMMNYNDQVSFVGEVLLVEAALQVLAHKVLVALFAGVLVDLLSHLPGLALLNFIFVCALHINYFLS